jgi:hypothetical protein
MDENVTLSNQMEKETGPVILIAKFNVNPADTDQSKSLDRRRYSLQAADWIYFRAIT